MRNSTLAEEGPLKISQPIKIPLLLDEEEMKDLLKFLEEKAPTVAFYNTHGLTADHEGIYKTSEFFDVYWNYTYQLKEKRVPIRREFSTIFSSALSVTPDIFYSMSFDNGKRIIKPILPPIQLQPHEITYSEESGSFYSMVYSEKSITFGIQFSYPNYYQNPHTHEVHDIDNSFPNTSLFKALRIWIREKTMPTPFMVGSKRLNQPFRLGKKCLPWINNHPQLKEYKVSIFTKEDKTKNV